MRQSPTAGQQDASATEGIVVEPEEQARADMYALVARMLHASPDAVILSTLASADGVNAAHDGHPHPLDRAWERLVLAAGVMDEAAVASEFNALFVSVGTPRLNPYASLYLTGFINEKPLVALRDDLARLGLGRTPGQREMEDHLGALCEAMRLMIIGAHSLAHQHQFFDTHIAPWFGRCLHDIRSDPEANFYRLVADFAQAFLDVEAAAFALDDEREAA